MNFRPIVLCALLSPSLALAAVGEPDLFPFDPAALSGWWAESYNTEEACGPQNLRTRMRVDPAARRLELRFDRKWKTELGETDTVGAGIIRATGRSLVLRYDGETRRKPNGEPVEWELTIVAPGVYRWRETDWKPGEVNTVVGIRCAP